MSASTGWAVLAAAFVGYWVGSFSPAAVAARLRGADLRGTGSGNPGATNAARAMGPAVGVLVGLVDVAKGFLPAWFFARYGDPAGQIAGLCAVLGHITSPFLRGRGGKGVATSLGAILAVEPIWALPALAGFAVTVGLTRRVGMGSVVATLILLPTSVLLWDGWAGVVFAVGLSALVLWRHRRNIRAFLLERSGG